MYATIWSKPFTYCTGFMIIFQILGLTYNKFFARTSISCAALVIPLTPILWDHGEGDFLILSCQIFCLDVWHSRRFTFVKASDRFLRWSSKAGMPSMPAKKLKGICRKATSDLPKKWCRQLLFKVKTAKTYDVSPPADTLLRAVLFAITSNKKKNWAHLFITMDLQTITRFAKWCVFQR